MKQQESSPFTTAGKSFDKNYILHGFTICVYHEGMITKEYEITKRVRDHFSRICDDKKSYQKKFWNTIRPYISSRKKQSFHNERIVLKDHGGVIRKQKKDAKVQAEYFSSSQHPGFNQLPPSI